MALPEPTPALLAESLKTRRYGLWGGDSVGKPYQPGRCGAAVTDWSRISRQCTRKPGYGREGCYCKQHARWDPAPKDPDAVPVPELTPPPPPPVPLPTFDLTLRFDNEKMLQGFANWFSRQGEDQFRTYCQLSLALTSRVCYRSQETQPDGTIAYGPWLENHLITFTT